MLPWANSVWAQLSTISTIVMQSCPTIAAIMLEIHQISRSLVTLATVGKGESSTTASLCLIRSPLFLGVLASTGGEHYHRKFITPVPTPPFTVSYFCHFWCQTACGGIIYHHQIKVQYGSAIRYSDHHVRARSSGNRSRSTAGFVDNPTMIMETAMSVGRTIWQRYMNKTSKSVRVIILL